MKVGYQADIFEVGKTAFSVDAYFGKDIAGRGSKSDSYGAQVVQNLDYLQTELYLGARRTPWSRRLQISRIASLFLEEPGSSSEAMPAAAAGHAARSSRIRSFRLLRWAMCVRAVGRGYVDTFNARKEK
ncbi:hypothetical protein D9M72_581550 [compost metagenome]